MRTSIVICCLLLLAAAACRKEKPAEPETNIFRFVYNGQTYNYSISYNIANAGAGRTHEGKGFIMIDMPDVFHGRIEFEEPGCAFFNPLFYSAERSRPCELFFRNPD